jgi:hypothetical protein
MTSEIDLSPVFKRCLYCGNEYPIRFFRRWHMMKFRVMPTCSGCNPAKTLKQMTPAERKRALETSHRNHSAAFVEGMSQREKEHNYNSRLADLQYARHAHKRRENWRLAILEQAYTEVRWARAALARYGKAVEGRPERKPYIEFFEEYIKVLDSLIESAEVRSKEMGAPLKPTAEESNPITYIDPLMFSYLKELYNKCPVIPGTRAPRDPWILYWKK